MGERKSFCSCNECRGQTQQRTERIEQLLGDLIGLTAKMNVRIANEENQLAELEFILARLDSRYKILEKKHESILLRLAKLSAEMNRRQSFVLEGRDRFPQSSDRL
ncbi:hypothetical protein [Bacillus sp. CECT 9360]|uniref:hypothetical protein n=1 Tax=Bacillus sp. CECT 9360 TaxID=2845821 RepID=UPI001E4A68DF|nr:hypothetical protein [Bacillus sp. CECT 9360]CAH0345111.1 hypothetical protein BCI9360_01389 [Bacillus sp. CECT 9360]